MKRENGETWVGLTTFWAESCPSQTCYVEVLTTQYDPGSHLEAGSLTADIIN